MPAGMETKLNNIPVHQSPDNNIFAQQIKYLCHE
jgi:hypothetical protein